jgi:hypothetical protein
MKVVWCVVVLEEKRSKCHADNIGSRSVDMMFMYAGCTPIYKPPRPGVCRELLRRPLSRVSREVAEEATTT